MKKKTDDIELEKRLSTGAVIIANLEDEVFVYPELIYSLDKINYGLLIKFAEEIYAQIDPDNGDGWSRKVDEDDTDNDIRFEIHSLHNETLVAAFSVEEQRQVKYKIKRV